MKKYLLGIIVAALAVTIVVPTMSLYNKDLGTVNSGSVNANAAETFDLLYLTNGSNVSPSTMPQTEKKLKLNQEVTLSDMIPEREGFIFKGWSLTGGSDNDDDIVTSVTIGMDGLQYETQSSGKIRYKVWACWEEAPEESYDDFLKLTKYITHDKEYVSDSHNYLHEYFHQNNRKSNLDSTGPNFGVYIMDDLYEINWIKPGDVSFAIKTWGDKKSYAFYWTYTDLRAEDDGSNAQVYEGQTIDIVKIVVRNVNGNNYNYEIETGTAQVAKKTIYSSEKKKDVTFYAIDTNSYEIDD